MKKSLLFITILILCGCSWSQKNKQLWTTFTILHAVDTYQTMSLINKPEINETNPLLGNDPSKEQIITFMGLNYVLLYFITDQLTEEQRNKFLLGANIVKIGVVGNNFMVGINF